MALVLFLFAFSFFWLAASIRRALFSTTTGWAQVSAAVTGYLNTTGPNFSPVLHFYYSGAEYFIKLPTTSRIPLYPLNTKLNVRVCPQEPRRFSVETATLKNAAHLLTAFGIIFLSVAALAFRGNFYSLIGGLLIVVPLLRQKPVLSSGRSFSRTRILIEPKKLFDAVNVFRA